MGTSAIVIGAGLGGLSTAIRLAHSGVSTRVLEKNASPGGRCNVWTEQGFTFDTGPTLLLMRDVLDDLFASVGRRLEDYLDLVRVRPNYRITFGDGTVLEVSDDRAAMIAQLERIEPGAGQRYGHFLNDAGFKYRVARRQFVERNFRHLFEFITPANLYYLFKTNTLHRLFPFSRRFFRDERLRIAFSFQTMYLGISPYDAPAVYSLLPYTEIAEGIWFPRGGMYQIVRALLRLADELGVRIDTETEVTEILESQGRASGVRLSDGRTYTADVVVCNADLPYGYRHLVPRGYGKAYRKGRLDRLRYGSSSFMMYLGTDKGYPQLLHHNVFLSPDVKGNFADIFQRRVVSDRPSFYINCPTRTDPSLAPEGGDNIYILVPVPHLTLAVDWERETARLRHSVLTRLAELGITDLSEHIVLERSFTPIDYKDTYNLARGATFGIAHDFFQVGYMRPANKANDLDRLYFVGASTVPGGGVPMVIIGSRLVHERIMAEVVTGAA